MMPATLKCTMLALFFLFAACFAAEVIINDEQVVINQKEVNPSAISTYKKPFLHWSMFDDPTCPECTSPAPGVYCPCNTPSERNRTQPWPWGPLPPWSLNYTIGVNGSRTVLVRDEPSLKPDLTSQFYARQISGQDPHTMPIVVEQRTAPTGNSETEPIILLGYANTTVLTSFISLPLVKALNLSETIRPENPAHAYYEPERHLTALFGYETSSVGLVSIRLLAGKNDKAREVDFRVIHAPKLKETPGIWHPDVVLGLNVLNALNALQLSAEFTGSDETGAKEGLGILVQTVVGGGKVTEPAGHDEL